MIKFKTSELDGYGFDLFSDRVIRFNKHPDGTYLNTRATYSINKKQFTHYDLRTKAIQDQDQSKEELPIPAVSSKRWWIITIIVLILVLPMSECSFETSSNVTIENIK